MALAATQAQAAASAQAAGVSVTPDQARQIALQHAGLSEDAVIFVKTWLDMDDGRLEYEVEFYSGNKEYDYDIDAQTGAVLSFDQDFESDLAAVQAYTSGNASIITEQQAQQAALQHAGIAEKDAIFIKTGLDVDDGRLIWEVEFFSGMKEYDYDIDAQSGAVLSFDQDYESEVMAAALQGIIPSAQEAAKTPASVSGPISRDQALQIALQHAGVAQSQISKLKVEQDFDDGVQKYEVEFNVGRTEYDYDIEVSSGRILSFEVDND